MSRQRESSSSMEDAVRFEFYDPKEEDEPVMKPMLSSLIDGSHWNTSELAHTVATQRSVGIVVKAAGGDDPIAVCSALPLVLYKQHHWLVQLHQFVRSRCHSSRLLSRVDSALSPRAENDDVALFVSERPSNAPDELAPHLLRGVLDEMSWATEDEESQQLRDAFKLSRLVCLTWCYAAFVDGTAADAYDEEPASSSARKRKRASTNTAASSNTVSEGKHKLHWPAHAEYAKAEDRELHKRADWSFVFRARGSRFLGDTPGLQHMRLVYCVSINNAREAQHALEQTLGGPEEEANGET